MIVSKRLFLGFSVIIILAVIVGAMGITGMHRLREASRSVYESHVLGFEYTGKAAAAFEQTRLNCRQSVINSFYDDLRGASETRENFLESANEFRMWIEKGISVAASDELARFYVRILDLFENSFMPRAELLIAESIKDIPDHTESLYINVLLESLIEIGEHLENVVIGSMDLNTALVQQANEDNNRFTRFFIMVQTGLLLSAVIIAVLIALFITKSITVPINEAASVLSKVAKGDFEARVQGDYKGELARIKKSVNETAAQLSVYLKEKVQEEKTRSFAAILSIADAGIAVMDKEGLLRDWNVGAEKILGYKHEDIIGKSPLYFIPEEVRSLLLETYNQLKSGKHIANIEEICIHKDGRLVSCSSSHTPLFDDDGMYNGSVVIFHDITEKILAEKEVKRFAAFAEAADAGIIITDKNFTIQAWNTGAEHILGYSAREMIGKAADCYSPESELPKVAEMYQRLRAGERIGRTDILQRHKNDSLIDCSAYYTPYFDVKGRFDGIVAIIHDISERKQMEKELQEALQVAEEASKVKSTFLANMSHEIRTPMNAVISMTELLLEEALTPKQHSYLLDIKVSGANLLGIINDILDFSKIESGNFEIIPVHFDFTVLLRNIQSTFDFVARNKQLEFVLQTEGEQPRYLFGDDIRIQQILTNLLSNAVKFTLHGQVSLTTRADEHKLYFDVADTGMGIKEEGLGKLFDSFQQLDAAANRKKTGTGLGLSITKSLVEMMEGEISVSSEYGVGTVFHVSIPRVDGDPARLKPEKEGARLSLHAPDALVLVVDDHEANLRVAAGLLGLSGIQCDTACDGETALKMVGEKRYDLVFMDHMMPGMDGVETMQRMREMGHDKVVLPIVALTANAISGVREMLLEQGMNDFLSKPIDRTLLTEILLRWLPRQKVQVREAANPGTNGGTGQEATESLFIRNLRPMSEINIDAALELMGGLEELYESAFMITQRKLPENIGKLDGYLENESLYDFAIEVHGLKGALNNIGCSLLGNYAANLEKAAKAEDRDYCRHHYGDFKRRILEFHEKAGKIIDAMRQEDRQKGDAALLRERLAAAKSACDEYDSFSAYEVLMELTRYAFSPEVDALMEHALRSAENCDYDDALERIRQMEELGLSLVG